MIFMIIINYDDKTEHLKQSITSTLTTINLNKKLRYSL